MFFLGLFGQVAQAANGTHSTGATAAASAMGGTAVSNYQGETEALFRNPAMVGKNSGAVMSPRLEISSAFAKHSSQAAVSVGSSTLPAYTQSKDSVNPLPNIAAGMKITDSVAVALGIVGVGGSTVDFTGDASLSEQKSEQALYRFVPAVSVVPVEGLRLGAGLIVGYSSIGLNYSVPLLSIAQSGRPPRDAWAAGGIFGATYSPVDKLNIGATFLTKTKFTFTELYNVTLLSSAPDVNAMNTVVIAEPQEFALGVSYDFDPIVFAVDFRHIAWASAEGYSHLGWASQNVISVGLQYRMEKLALRTGVNYGKSPIRDASGVNGDNTHDFQGTTVSDGLTQISNVTGFTATTELELQVGAGYQFDESLSADLAFALSPAKTITQSGTITNPATATPNDPYIVSSKASEWVIVAGVNYQF